MGRALTVIDSPGFRAPAPMPGLVELLDAFEARLAAALELPRAILFGESVRPFNFPVQATMADVSHHRRSHSRIMARRHPWSVEWSCAGIRRPRLRGSDLPRAALGKLAKRYAVSRQIAASAMAIPYPVIKHSDLLGPDILRRLEAMEHARSITRAVMIDRDDERPTRWVNRHDVKRWLRTFADVAAVAEDALLEGDRPRAIRLLCEIIALDDAIDLTVEREPAWRRWQPRLKAPPGSRRIRGRERRKREADADEALLRAGAVTPGEIAVARFRGLIRVSMVQPTLRPGDRVVATHDGAIAADGHATRHHQAGTVVRVGDGWAEVRFDY